jgi:hypothetical protein
MAGRKADARAAVQHMGGLSPPGMMPGAYQEEATRQRVAQAAARAIARFITGLESDAPLAAGWETLLTTFGQTAFALEFHDDVHFFRGELARRRGDIATAMVHYQRCIDLSRDPWPANWSRFRLAQLASSPYPAEREVAE